MGNILRSQCSSENGLCMCLRSPGTAEADGEFVESREVSVPSSGGVASGLSEERSAGRKKQPRPSSKARRKHAAASAKLSGGDATPEQTAKSPACSSGSAAAAVGAALAKNENSEETVAAGTSAPRSEEEDNVSGASELVWLADSLTLPVDETVALRIQRQQPLEVQRQLLESLFGRWQGEGKGVPSQRCFPRQSLVRHGRGGDRAVFNSLFFAGCLQAFPSTSSRRRGAFWEHQLRVSLPTRRKKCCFRELTLREVGCASADGRTGVEWRSVCEEGCRIPGLNACNCFQCFLRKPSLRPLKRSL